MNRILNRILTLLVALPLLTACEEELPNSKLIINEVLVINESNFQDDYGQHNAWVEIFNKSYGSADLAGWYLECRNGQAEPVKYFIPKGDVLTLVKPRQHTLFWADGEPRRGTFHTNFRLDPSQEICLRLYDSGRKLMDEVYVPAGRLAANQSWARVSDASPEWEVKDDSEHSYVTPSTNNKTMDSNAKMEKFAEHDSVGVGMAISAMSVVFCGLLLLFIAFKIVGIISIKLHDHNYHKAKDIVVEKHHQQEMKEKQAAAEKAACQAPDEVYAAIAMALHEMNANVHDRESQVLTIRRRVSAWGSKFLNMRQLPK